MLVFFLSTHQLILTMKILRNATGVQKIQFQSQHTIALIFNMHVYTIKPCSDRNCCQKTEHSL